MTIVLISFKIIQLSIVQTNWKIFLSGSEKNIHKFFQKFEKVISAKVAAWNLLNTNFERKKTFFICAWAEVTRFFKSVARRNASATPPTNPSVRIQAAEPCWRSFRNPGTSQQFRVHNSFSNHPFTLHLLCKSFIYFTCIDCLFVPL